MPTPSQRLRERGTGLSGRSALEIKTLTGRGGVKAPFMYITVYGIIYTYTYTYTVDEVQRLLWLWLLLSLACQSFFFLGGFRENGRSTD